MSKIEKIIDADLYPLVPLNGKKSAVKVSVFNQNKLIDCDALQMSDEILLGRMRA